MPNPRIILSLAVITLLFSVGCSDEEGSPTALPHAATGVLSFPGKAIGPSEIVLCLDVSDSISTDALQAVVGSLEVCLANPSLIPQDGRVGIATVVYGDTTANVLAPPVPVTAENLQNTIVPALRDLLNDRLVATDGFDLAGGLDASAALLEPSTVSDLHVLVLASGVADDEAAVQTSCAALSEAGVMVSAVAVDADAAGAALLESCTASTGGFFGQGETDLAATCAEALAYMLQVDIDLEPEQADLARGDEHSVTATVFRGGNAEDYPEVDLEVTISVVAGPNMDLTTTAVTDTNGTVSFAYTGDGGPGMDTIVAETLHPGTGVALRDTVTVTWTNTAPTCDAGGPYLVVVAADTVQVTLDGNGSGDADGDTLNYMWSVQCAEASFDDATAVAPVLTFTGACLCVDSLTVDLTVNDGFVASSCQTIIRLDDQRPPVIEVREGPLVLWPPNHKYQHIAPEMFIVSAEDACGRPIDLTNVVVVEVRSDEPEDAIGTGDGRTSQDIVVHCPASVMLRAERAGSENGRVYTIVYRIDGENGVSAGFEAQVTVPHDSSGDAAVEDEDMGYTVQPDCGEEG